jgi:hypothetical protein
MSDADLFRRFAKEAMHESFEATSGKNACAGHAIARNEPRAKPIRFSAIFSTWRDGGWSLLAGIGSWSNYEPVRPTTAAGSFLKD